MKLIESRKYNNELIYFYKRKSVEKNNVDIVIYNIKDEYLGCCQFGGMGHHLNGVIPLGIQVKPEYHNLGIGQYMINLFLTINSELTPNKIITLYSNSERVVGPYVYKKLGFKYFKENNEIMDILKNKLKNNPYPLTKKQIENELYNVKDLNQGHYMYYIL